MLSARKEGLSTAKVVSTCGTVKRISPSAWMQGLRTISRLLTISCSLKLVANQRSPPASMSALSGISRTVSKRQSVFRPSKKKEGAKMPWSLHEFAEYGPWVLRFGVNLLRPIRGCCPLVRYDWQRYWHNEHMCCCMQKAMNTEHV